MRRLGEAQRTQQTQTTERRLFDGYATLYPSYMV